MEFTVELLLNFFNDRHYWNDRVNFGTRLMLCSHWGFYRWCMIKENVWRARTAGSCSWYPLPLLASLLAGLLGRFSAEHMELPFTQSRVRPPRGCAGILHLGRPKQVITVCWVQRGPPCSWAPRTAWCHRKQKAQSSPACYWDGWIVPWAQSFSLENECLLLCWSLLGTCSQIETC